MINIMAFLKKPVVILAIIVVLLITVLSPFATTGGIFDEWNTTGETEANEYGITGAVTFNKANYIGSWLSNMDSETMTIQGKLKFTNTGYELPTVGGWRYLLYQEGNDVPIQKFPSDGYYQPGGQTSVTWDTWIYFESWSTEVKSDGTIRLKVVMEFEGGAYWDDGGLFGFAEWKDIPGPFSLGWDGAYLKSGRGEITLSGSQGPFEEGSTATVTVRTGFTGGAGWFVKLYPPASRTDLTTTTIATLGDDVVKNVEIPIKDGYYTESLNPADNEFRVELWNNYFDVGFQQLFAVDSLDRIPIIVDVAEINNGDSITYTITMEATYAAIQGIKVYAWYSYGGTTMPSTADTESWVLYDKTYTGASTVSFTVYPKSSLDGTITVKCFAFDVGGRVSEPEYMSIVVEDGKTTPGDDPLTPEMYWSWQVIALLALAAIAFIGIINFLPGDMLRKMSAALIVAGSLALLAYGWGIGWFL
ncbi:MAG: hypothetical protein PHT77_10325 [Bacteroidales bacterium]|nr:hypothetical protein [Bacteroidales bacterium]